MRRLFSLAIGLGAGIALGASAVRRLDGVVRAVRPRGRAQPAGAVDRLLERAGAVRVEARRLAAVREAELRDRFDVPDLPSRRTSGRTPAR